MSAPSNSKIVLKILSDASQTQLDEVLVEDESLPNEEAELVKLFMQACAGGNESAEMQLLDGAVSATGIFTVASSGAQTLTVAGVALTGGTDYVIADLTAAEIAANIADAINDSSDASIQLVGAEASDDTVVVTAIDPGLVGNYIPISATGDVSASGSTLSGGTSGDLKIYQYGLR